MAIKHPDAPGYFVSAVRYVVYCSDSIMGRAP